MGNRFHRSADSSTRMPIRRHRSRTQSVTYGKNRPLKRVPIRWRSSFPITSTQLQRKRDEFWDTAPAFEGRIEIWNALKAAAEFFEKQDYDMAQAILDGACIILPTGTLCDCYDELGARYQLPLYVFGEPSNLLHDSTTSDPNSLESHNQDSPTRTHYTTQSSTNNDSSQQQQHVPTCNEDENHSRSRTGTFSSCWPLFASFRLRRQPNSTYTGRYWCTHTIRSMFSNRPISKSEAHETPTQSPVSNTISPLLLRLSTGEDHKLEIPNDQITILDAKRLLANRTGWSDTRQRWFVCGHALPNRARICDCRIPSGFLIQVVVHSPFEPESQWSQRTVNLSNPTDLSPSSEPMCLLANVHTDSANSNDNG